jgi:hypothetical protein
MTEQDVRLDWIQLLKGRAQRSVLVNWTMKYGDSYKQGLWPLTEQ